jgi:ribonuclease HI
MNGIELWTDASYKEYKKVGAWACIIKDEKNTQFSEAQFMKSKIPWKTKVKRLELLAILMGLKKLNELNEPKEITVYSDAMTIIDVANNITDFESRGWLKSKKTHLEGQTIGRFITNHDLWIELNELLKTTHHKIKFIWIKGHSGISLNEEVNTLARNTRENYELNNF